MSDVCGGDMSDVEVVRKSGLLDKVARNIVNAEILNARIHVERVIGRMKAFKILQGPIPFSLLMKYLLNVVL